MASDEKNILLITPSVVDADSFATGSVSSSISSESGSGSRVLMTKIRKIQLKFFFF